jgi:hypothetical protein
MVEWPEALEEILQNRHTLRRLELIIRELTRIFLRAAAIGAVLERRVGQRGDAWPVRLERREREVQSEHRRAD